MMTTTTRRHWLAATTGSALLRPLQAAPLAPAAPVAIGKCTSYGKELLPALGKLFDQIGGLGRLVAGKTVTIKVNLTGPPTGRLGHLSAEMTYWTHPAVIGATVHLLGRAGARRIRVVECAHSTAEPLAEFILRAGWEPNDILNAAANVELYNTNALGTAKQYSRMMTPKGGHMFKGFLLNHAYEECDVFMSIAKMKEHLTTGITLAMKNCFGITPCTIYGDHAPKDEPGDVPKAGRGFLHSGARQPSSCAYAENDPKSPRDGGYRIPRIVADLAAARPIHISLIDGIATMNRAEGPWGGGGKAVHPGVLFVGTNAVCTDAVGTAIMGFDPMADRGTIPFERCDSTLRLAEELGVGTRDLKHIEVVGTSIKEARFEMRKA